MRKLTPLVFLFIFLALFCTQALAEEKPAKQNVENLPWSEFNINMGVFLSSTNSNVRLSAKGIGVGIDVEDALGLDTTTNVLRLGGTWRFSDNRRHRADVSWFALRRNGDTTLGRDIVINGVTYPTGTAISTALDLDVYKTSYTYSFLQDDRMDVGFGLGLYIMPISFDFNASGFVTGDASESVTAPLPVFGLRADYALTPKWFLKTSMDFFYLEYKQFRGAVFDTRLALEYKAFKHVGFGLGVDNFRLKVEGEGEDYPEIDLNGQIEYNYFGAMLYTNVYF